MVEFEAKKIPTSKGTRPDIPWTASRCTRLLRPLVSKLAALRRLRAQNDGNARSSSDDGVEIVSSGQNSIEETATQCEGVWDPLARRTTVKKTYRSRHVMQEKGRHNVGRRSSTPENLSIPTPLVRRAQANSQPEQSGCNDITEQNVSLFAAKSSSGIARYSGLCKEISSIQRTQESSMRDFLRILQATRGSSETRVVSRSLFATCLRQMPIAMDVERECRLLDNKDDKSDVETEAYSMLEEYGACGSQGWSPLGHLVRAHGIHLIHTAIKNELIDHDKVPSFLMSCLVSCEDEEVILKLESGFLRLNDSVSEQDLRANWFDFKPGYISKRLFWPSESFINGCLWTPSTRLRFLIEAIGKGVTSSAYLEYPLVKHLSGVALMEMMKPRWDCLFLAQELLERLILSYAGVHQHSMDKVLSRLPQENKQSVKNTEEVAPHVLLDDAEPSPNIRSESGFSACLSLLSITGIMYSSIAYTHGDDCFAHTHSIVRKASLGVMRAYTSRDLIQEAQEQRMAFSAAAVLFSDTIATIVGQNINKESHNDTIIGSRLSFVAQFLDDKQTTLLLNPTHVFGLAKILDSFGHNVIKGCGRQGFDTFQRVCRYLIDFRSNCQREMTLVNSIALEASMLFARQTNDPTHLQHARTIEARIQVTKRECVDTPVRRKSAASSLRWEEGLCEWVMTTPFPTISPKSTENSPTKCPNDMPDLQPSLPHSVRPLAHPTDDTTRRATSPNDNHAHFISKPTFDSSNPHDDQPTQCAALDTTADELALSPLPPPATRHGATYRKRKRLAHTSPLRKKARGRPLAHTDGSRLNEASTPRPRQKWDEGEEDELQILVM